MTSLTPISILALMTFPDSNLNASSNDVPDSNINASSNDFPGPNLDSSFNDFNLNNNSCVCHVRLKSPVLGLVRMVSVGPARAGAHGVSRA